VQWMVALPSASLLLEASRAAPAKLPGSKPVCLRQQPLTAASRCGQPRCDKPILLPPPGAEDEREGDRGETERETAEERLCERVRGRIIFGIFLF
jgi:hypothetical protein